MEFVEGTEEKHEKRVSVAKFEPGTYRIRNRGANHKIATLAYTISLPKSLGHHSLVSSTWRKDYIKKRKYQIGYLLPKKVKIKIYRTVTLPAVLYGCEPSSLTIRAEPRLGVSENRVLSRIRGPKTKEVRGGGRNCITRNFVICTPHQIL